MKFGVLGSVEVWVDGRPVNAGHPRQRAVLAVLALDAGRMVPLDVLIDRVWGENPPRSVRNVAYGYVARLRVLVGNGTDPGMALSRRPGGYLLRAGPDEVDLTRFRHLVAEAARLNDDERAGAALDQAVGLWRGPALADLDSPWLNAMRTTLELERAAAAADLGDIRLRRGEHGALAGELAGQAAAAPGDERLIGQLMLALYRSGRRAEALHWYEQTRQHLADELGADPGPQLSALHQRILRADPCLALPRAPIRAVRPGAAIAPSGPRAAPAPPRELPADVSAFTGRVAELHRLDQLLSCRTTRADRPPAAVVSAVAGTAGVGKTALAIHWAHRVADEFPDGQLHVNLRGYDPAQPLTAADALAVLLRALGLPDSDIPAGEDRRAACFRSLLAGKRMLVLVDNARTAEQVRPLLPGARTCAVVVTSRDSLVGLVARDGAVRVDLDVLPLDDVISLLRELIGERVDADPAAAVELARQCSRLPLALRVAAELAAARPGIPLAELVAELGDQQRRLDLLGADGDPRTAVRTVFSWSYRRLGPDAARTFRLSGLHPGPDFDAYAIAALTATTADQARQALRALARAHLIHPTGPDRYALHDLLRAYARELASTEDSDDERHAALTRLCGHNLYAAANAMNTLFPPGQRGRPPITSPAHIPPLTELGEVRAWLGEQRALLIAVAADCPCPGPSRAGHTARMDGTLLLRANAILRTVTAVFSAELERQRGRGRPAAGHGAATDKAAVGSGGGWPRLLPTVGSRTRSWASQAAPGSSSASARTRETGNLWQNWSYW
jgi:DNA-binding SARP family transcriptional activator